MADTERDLREQAKYSQILGDLYSLKEYLFESPLPIKTFYLQRVEGSFSRPSFLIKFVSFPSEPYNAHMTTRLESMMIQFFTESTFEAHAIADQVCQLLRPDGRDLILPRYDFTQDPPRKIPVNERMGTRVDPTTISAEPFEEPDGGWNVPITFTMRSDLLHLHEGIPLENVILESLGPEDGITRTSTDISGTASMEAESV
jgi:hypothetical protein